jgi:hypothetical protein
MKAASPRPTTADQRPNIQVVAAEVGTSVNPFDLFGSTLGASDGLPVDRLTGDVVGSSTGDLVGEAVGSSTGDLVGEAVGRSSSVHPAT